MPTWTALRSLSFTYKRPVKFVAKYYRPISNRPHTCQETSSREYLMEKLHGSSESKDHNLVLTFCISQNLGIAELRLDGKRTKIKLQLRNCRNGNWKNRVLTEIFTNNWKSNTFEKQLTFTHFYHFSSSLFKTRNETYFYFLSRGGCLM